MPLVRNIYTWLRAAREGQSLVEFALLMPILLLLTLGAVDFGRALHAVTVVNNAAYSSAVWAAENLRYGNAGAANCGVGTYCCPTANNTAAPSSEKPTSIREAALRDFSVGLDYTTTCSGTGLSSTCNPHISCSTAADSYTYGASATAHRYVEVTLTYRWTAIGPYDALVGSIDVPRTVRVRRLP